MQKLNLFFQSSFDSHLLPDIRTNTHTHHRQRDRNANCEWHEKVAFTLGVRPFPGPKISTARAFAPALKFHSTFFSHLRRSSNLNPFAEKEHSL